MLTRDNAAIVKCIAEQVRDACLVLHWADSKSTAYHVKRANDAMAELAKVFGYVLPDAPAFDLSDWLMKQPREYRLTILNELSDAEAEAQHDDRQRAGYPATDYAAECIRMAGRGHLLGGAR